MVKTWHEFKQMDEITQLRFLMTQATPEELVALENDYQNLDLAEKDEVSYRLLHDSADSHIRLLVDRVDFNFNADELSSIKELLNTFSSHVNGQYSGIADQLAARIAQREQELIAESQGQENELPPEPETLNDEEPQNPQDAPVENPLNNEPDENVQDGDEYDEPSDNQEPTTIQYDEDDQSTSEEAWDWVLDPNDRNLLGWDREAPLSTEQIEVIQQKYEQINEAMPTVEESIWAQDDNGHFTNDRMNNLNKVYQRMVNEKGEQRTDLLQNVYELAQMRVKQSYLPEHMPVSAEMLETSIFDEMDLITQNLIVNQIAEDIVKAQKLNSTDDILPEQMEEIKNDISFRYQNIMNGEPLNPQQPDNDKIPVSDKVINSTFAVHFEKINTFASFLAKKTGITDLQEKAHAFDGKMKQKHPTLWPLCKTAARTALISGTLALAGPIAASTYGAYKTFKAFQEMKSEAQKQELSLFDYCKKNKGRVALVGLGAITAIAGISNTVLGAENLAQLATYSRAGAISVGVGSGLWAAAKSAVKGDFKTAKQQAIGAIAGTAIGMAINGWVGETIAENMTAEPSPAPTTDPQTSLNEQPDTTNIAQNDSINTELPHSDNTQLNDEVTPNDTPAEENSHKDHHEDRHEDTPSRHSSSHHRPSDDGSSHSDSPRHEPHEHLEPAAPNNSTPTNDINSTPTSNDNSTNETPDATPTDDNNSDQGSKTTENHQDAPVTPTITLPELHNSEELFNNTQGDDSISLTQGDEGYRVDCDTATMRETRILTIDENGGKQGVVINHDDGSTHVMTPEEQAGTERAIQQLGTCGNGHFNEDLAHKVINAPRTDLAPADEAVHPAEMTKAPTNEQTQTPDNSSTTPTVAEDQNADNTSKTNTTPAKPKVIIREYVGR